MTRICSIGGCTRPVSGYGWCNTHYERWRRHGDPQAAKRIASPAAADRRFWAQVEKNGPFPQANTLAAGKGPCWLWTGGTANGGYGRMYVEGRLTRAHRFAYELIRGPIPDGLVIDHLCRVPACVNPEHLEPVTSKENTWRGIGGAAARRTQTHCKHDHEFTPENTYFDSKNRRVCRACKRIAQANRRAARR